MFKNYGDDTDDVYLYLVMKMVTFNYDDVLLSVVMLCILGESCINKWYVDDVMTCIYESASCMHTRIESRRNGDELVMKKSDNIPLTTWRW